MLQGVASALSHVSQKHLEAVKPTARQFGLAAERVLCSVPVELVRSIGNAASWPPDGGGQSRLVAPKKTFGEDPLMSQL